ncbi:hypothetical protein ACFQ60_20985 [Streptomyces zhihengii]
MARWASATEGTVVLGAGPHGPLSVDLTAEGPHLLVEGPAGSGRTELLRALAASSPPRAAPTGWACCWWTARAANAARVSPRARNCPMSPSIWWRATRCGCGSSHRPWAAS